MTESPIPVAEHSHIWRSYKIFDLEASTKVRPRHPSNPHLLFSSPTSTPSSPPRLRNEDIGVAPGRRGRSHTFPGLGVARFQESRPWFPWPISTGLGLQMQSPRTAVLSSDASLLGIVPVLSGPDCADGLGVLTHQSRPDIPPLPLQMGP